MATQYTLATVYLNLSTLFLRWGYKAQAMTALSLALGECNRYAMLKVERRHVMRALNSARRITAS